DADQGHPAASLWESLPGGGSAQPGLRSAGAGVRRAFLVRGQRPDLRVGPARGRHPGRTDPDRGAPRRRLMRGCLAYRPRPAGGACGLEGGDRMQRIPREQARKYAFDWRDEPLLRVRCGESFEVETYDASTGYFKSTQDLAIPARRPGFDRSPPHANPIAGPVYLQGAERGDTLVVSVEDITVADYSWIAVGPRRGPLGESTRWP